MKQLTEWDIYLQKQAKLTTMLEANLQQIQLDRKKEINTYLSS